jgi:hypothetical protein
MNACRNVLWADLVDRRLNTRVPIRQSGVMSTPDGHPDTAVEEHRPLRGTARGALPRLVRRYIGPVVNVNPEVRVHRFTAPLLRLTHRDQFAYVDPAAARRKHTSAVPAALWRATGCGFAIHLVSRDGHEDAVLPGGDHVGTPEEALDWPAGPTLHGLCSRPRRARTDGSQYGRGHRRSTS